MAAVVSKADYLRKYLSGGDEKERKKKRKRAKQTPKQTSRVVDDDVDWKSLSASKRLSGDSAPSDEDDKPTVAEVRDERDEARIKAMWVPMKAEEEKVTHSAATQRDSYEDLSPPRKKRHDSPEDLSPPRRKRHDSPEGLSPPRRKRHDSPEDLSPPRRKRHDSPEDLSPPRRKRHDSPEDLSPPRRKRHDSPEDLSPPRRRRHDSPEDLSPPRRKRHNSPEDLSPPRRKQGHQSSSNPSLRPQGPGGRVPPSRTIHLEGESAAGKEKMSSGAVAGLSSVEDMRRESAVLRQSRAEVLSGMDPAMSGRGAETVYRDKTGRRIDSKLERLRQREVDKKKEEEMELFMEWGTGVAQRQQAKEAAADAVYEMSKPLARYRDDEDLERLQRDQEREGDPMLAYLRRKKAKQRVKEGKKEKPSWQGPFPQNRFNLRPGYRWDGVDRSNGFEKDWFSREANSKAVAEMSYKWSVEDM